MPALRTTYTVTVRSYEVGPSQEAPSAQLLRWFQEAAYANSAALGYRHARYYEMGVFWVLHEIDLEIFQLPTYGQDVHITTWIADMVRVRGYRQYEARLESGELLAQCSAIWVMIDQHSQRPARIPQHMLDEIDAGQDFVVETREWLPVSGAPHAIPHRVSFYEEDELAHVNHAMYLDWAEESARCAAQAAGIAPPRFTRHSLHYHQPSFRGDELRIESTFTPEGDGLRWQHTVWRDDERLFTGWSLSDSEPIDVP